MNLGILLNKHVEKLHGEREGVCVLCGNKGRGFSINKVVSGNFTAWEFLNAGTIFCETCASSYKEQKLRRKSWIANQNEIIYFKNDDAEHYLFNPLEPPFFIHIAKKGQKQTWLSLFNVPAYNKNAYMFSYENFNYGIYFEKNKAKKYLDLIKFLLKKKVVKSELYQGIFKSKTWEKALKESYEEKLFEAKEYSQNPLWMVMVDVARI
ncbi:hypothetical protein [Marinitoga sp. 1138]|uniref:hypothetical protein n=1 Tax=Marinitoga sp. 1138 TaxID=1643334 RepID=UPI0015864436|nr:hypothetical protein [Marinitoga sp. 1138]NUU96744.1 hypothetical protein [Marinitoga sp. 1138]